MRAASWFSLAAIFIDSSMPVELISRIQPGKTYFVTMDRHRLTVRAIRPSAIAGWWLCEGGKIGELVMLPEGVLEQDETQQSDAVS
jgi:hypothetical protein